MIYILLRNLWVSLQIYAGGISNYWKAENMDAVTAKIDEQKTEVIVQEVIELDKKL